jgi:hypothetical protein
MGVHGKSFLIALLVVVCGAGSSQAVYYSITGGGGQTQIGDGLPLPLQPATVSGSPAGTGTMFPPLLIPPNPAVVISQTAGPSPKKMRVPPGAFYKKALPMTLGVVVFNPSIFQVRTNIEFSGPGTAFGSATISAGGRTGAATTVIMGVPAGSGQVRFSASAAQFGGPSRTRILPVTPIQVWGHSETITAPCKHPAFGGNSANPNDAGCIAIMVEAHPATLGVAGAPISAAAEMTPGGVVMTKGLRAVSVSSMGSVGMSAVVGMTAPLSNKATTEGFPFTTGMITISQPAAKGSAEVFTLTGGDTRMANGEGTISLVTGGLSNRTATGANANRAWARYTLPEPGAVLGAAAALAMLALCHRRARRISQRTG